jgi:acetyl esterase
MRGLVEKVEVELRAPTRVIAVATAIGLLSILGLAAFAVESRMSTTAKAPPTPIGGESADLGGRIVVYSQAQQRPLFLHLFEPPAAPTGAIIFFHGGGLVQTPLSQFKRQASDLALAGMLTVIVEYRVAWDGASFPEAAIDAGDAVTWVRDHAPELHLDPNKIAVAGVAVGGWMAASTRSLLPEAQPNAFVLIDPVLGGALAGLPEAGNRSAPTLILHAEPDASNPVDSSQQYCDQMIDCELVVWPGAQQGFFNADDSYEAVLDKIKVFCQHAGLL